ncbi:MAG: FKBP-type peptidyl-prolyl cis-trans isomerase, partial [Flavobacteriales bacterium]
MNSRMMLLPAVALGMFFFSSCQSGGKAELKDGIDSLSYCIGINLGEAFTKGDLPKLDLEIMKTARRHVLDSSDSQQIESMEAEAFIQEFLMQRQAKSAADKKIEGEKFLAENKTKEGVMTTASGLQYKVIQEGTGPQQKLHHKVKVHYHGTLADSTVFDSSIDRGQPAEFQVDQVIPGWSEALQMMSVGSKYMLYIPQELAYGDQGAGGAVPPFSTIIFEVELLSIDSTVSKEDAQEQK